MKKQLEAKGSDKVTYVIEAQIGVFSTFFAAECTSPSSAQLSQSMSDSNESAQQPEDTSASEFRFDIPPRYLILASGCGVLGMSLGLIRGSRAEGMRFLAENAHRPPTTLRGWYLYKKTKNYRMLWGGLREGGRKALQLGAIGATFAACEEGMGRIGFGEARETGAGVGTAVLFCAFCK